MRKSYDNKTHIENIYNGFISNYTYMVSNDTNMVFNYTTCSLGFKIEQTNYEENP